MGNVTDNGHGISISEYDHRNMPLSVTANGTSVAYSYDESGHRINKIAGSVKEYYLSDQFGRDIAVINDSTDNVTSFNLYGFGKIGRADVARDVIIRTYPTVLDADRVDYKSYYFKDHLGSIREVVDETETRLRR